MAKQKSDIQIERIRHALKLCARIIVLHGEVYFPLFERLERELKEAENKQKIRERVLAVLDELN